MTEETNLYEFLRQVARRLMEIFPQAAQIARLETDRFGAFTPAAPSTHEAIALLEDCVMAAVSAPYTRAGKQLRIAFEVALPSMPRGWLDDPTFWRED
jgi:GGDEF domain-containing protein